MSESKLYEELVVVVFLFLIFDAGDGGFTQIQTCWVTFLLEFGHFQKKIGEEDQNPKILKNSSLSKICFLFKFLK